jgi:DNA-binding transcriptional ArsR family regulator
MRPLSHPAPNEFTLPTVFHALSDPVRLEIVRALQESGELSCGALRAPVSKSTLSHHLKVLRDAGVIHTRPEGSRRVLSLRTADLEGRFPGLLSCVFEGLRGAA